MQPELPRLADGPRGRRTPMAYLRPFGALVVVAYVIGSVLGDAVAGPDADGQVISVLVGIPPWFLVIRSVRELRERQVAAEALVEELQESRAAQAEAAALAERGRVASDLHD